MATTAAFTFPWGRVHSTAWGRHVNEAEVEWPPSPWRLLRALYATWQARAPYLDAEVVERVLSDLTVLPTYRVPPTTMGHTRHYMPDGQVAIKSAWEEGTDKAFDGFAITARGARLVVTWPVELGEAGRAVLQELLVRLPYLGRAESICDAELLTDVPTAGPTVGQELAPVSASAAAESDLATVRLLAPRTPLDLAGLAVGTADVRRVGLLDPPAAYRAMYPARAEPPAGRPRVGHSRPRRAEAALLVLDAPAPPAMTKAVLVADCMRAAVQKAYGEESLAPSSISGHSADGVPGTGHGHAHWLVLPRKDNERIAGSILVWVPERLPEGALARIVARPRLYGYGLRPCRLVLAGSGSAADVVPELTGPARRWTSITPFAPPRHSKRGTPWTEHVRSQLVEEAGRRGLSPVVDVRLLPGSWLDFERRRRSRESLEQSRRAAGVEVSFAQPVVGPLALGALSHFGLGLFRPARGPEAS